VASTPLTFFALISATSFAFLLFLIWKHNHSSYQKRLGEWDHSFICPHCGTVSQQDPDGISIL
jgi:hypothetical protein